MFHSNLSSLSRLNEKYVPFELIAFVEFSDSIDFMEFVEFVDFVNFMEFIKFVESVSEIRSISRRVVAERSAFNQPWQRHRPLLVSNCCRYVSEESFDCTADFHVNQILMDWFRKTEAEIETFSFHYGFHCRVNSINDNFKFQLMCLMFVRWFRKIMADTAIHFFY